jgi:hypothetical protein
LQLEEAEAEIARADWAEHGEGPPPALVAREPRRHRRLLCRSGTRALSARR